MKIGIMTFFRVNNFGAVLQAYALQTTLRKMGNEVDIINYSCSFLEKPYKFVCLKEKGLIKYILGNFGYLTRKPRQKKFDRFRKENLQITKLYKKEELRNLEKKYDLFIAGSDQIWNLDATNGDMSYFLNFIDDSRKKMSYAASFAKNSVREKWKMDVQKSLQEFDTILVREENACKLVKDLSGRESKVVLDPVFLLKREEWESLASDFTKDERYILVYQQSITPKAMVCAKKLAAKENATIRCIPFPIGKPAKAKSKTDYSPQEWLGLIKNALYVVTDSFHGMAFSILFNKQFYIAMSQSNISTGSRLYQVLSTLNLEEQILQDDGWAKNAQKINYVDVNEKLVELRECALKELERCEDRNAKN